MYAKITVSGDDTRDFLQGQLTQDLRKVTPVFSPLAAWCTPQGRVISVMRLLTEPHGIGLVVPVELASDVISGMTVYRLRAKVVFESSDDNWRALAVANATDIELLKARRLLPRQETGASRCDGGIHVVCPDQEQQFFEVFAPADALATAELKFVAPLAAGDWQAARIAAGITDIVPATSRKFTPHMLNLDRLDAVSFDKGCYAGQEIVARTEHLGSAKRRVAHFRATAPVAIGDGVQLDGTTVGEIVAVAEREVLAVLPVALHNTALHAGRIALEPQGGN